MERKRGRPKGSRSKKKDGYKRRTEELKRLHGDNIFREWGALGGSPLLTKKNKDNNVQEDNGDGG